MAAEAIPEIQLLCLERRFSDAFAVARDKYELPSCVRINVHSSSLGALSPDVKFDTVVSPANSYGRLDGSFDDAISRAFAPRDDYLALTHAAQKVLYKQWRGFAPPGSCTLVRFPDEFAARSNNLWGTKRVALCPTMREPCDVRWDREIVYDCLWSLLCAVDNHNRDLPADSPERISKILMTPLATGVGRVSPQRWAAQAVLALKHFAQASDDPETWSKLGWDDFGESASEVERTWEL